MPWKLDNWQIWCTCTVECRLKSLALWIWSACRKQCYNDFTPALNDCLYTIVQYSVESNVVFFACLRKRQNVQKTVVNKCFEQVFYGLNWDGTVLRNSKILKPIRYLSKTHPIHFVTIVCISPFVNLKHGWIRSCCRCIQAWSESHVCTTHLNP